MIDGTWTIDATWTIGAIWTIDATGRIAFAWAQ